MDAVTGGFRRALGGMRLGARWLAALLLLIALGCDKKVDLAARRAGKNASAAAVPWQPHGFVTPTVRCDFAVPAGFTRSDSPMPGHLAELWAHGFGVHLHVAERVETTLPQALDRVQDYYRSGFLTAVDAQLVTNAPLLGCQATAHQLVLRQGQNHTEQIELVILFAFPGLSIINLVARFPQSDTQSYNDVLTIARSLRCAK
jgi:hypothetical protein